MHMIVARWIIPINQHMCGNWGCQVLCVPVESLVFEMVRLHRMALVHVGVLRVHHYLCCHVK